MPGASFDGHSNHWRIITLRYFVDIYFVSFASFVVNSFFAWGRRPRWGNTCPLIPRRHSGPLDLPAPAPRLIQSQAWRMSTWNGSAAVLSVRPRTPN